MDAMLTADSPQRLIDQLSVQRVMATEMSAQMNSYRAVNDQAAKARGGVRQVGRRGQDRRRAGRRGARRPAIQAKQLQVQMAVVKSQYEALTPGQREALAAVPPAPPAALPRRPR